MRPDAALRSRWDRTPGGRVHARVSTAVPPGAPPVVLVHGLVISSLYMVPTAVRLARHFPVLAPDLPGFGLSEKPRRVLTIPEMADALAGWMDAVGTPRAVLVGNSLGCQVIARLAERSPDRVLGAVLAGPTMDPRARSAPRQIGRWLRDWTREPPSLAVAHAVDYRRAGVRRAWRTFRHALDDRIEERLPRLAAPTLVVRGSEDTIVPQRWAEEAAALLPRGSLRLIPGGPHVVNYTTADAFAALVREFVGEALAGPLPGVGGPA